MHNIETLADLLPAFGKRGDRPAVMAARPGGFDVWSYGRLADTAGRIAAFLIGAGARPAEPVALLAPSRPEWIAAYFGIVAAGAAAVPLDALSTDAEIASALARTRCRRLFTVAEYLSRLTADWLADAAIILMDDGGEASGGAVAWAALAAADPIDLPIVSPDAWASMLFTSGTTGSPKVVPLTHRNFVSNLEALLAARIVAEGERVLLPLPLHHTYPFTVGMLGTLASGSILVLASGRTGPQILEALRAGEIAVMIGVPGLYTALRNGITARAKRSGGPTASVFPRLLALSAWLRRTLGLRLGRLLFARIHAEFGSRLRVLASGGAKLDSAVAWDLEGLGWRVLSGYGLTETAPMLTFNRPDRARLDSEGLPVAGVELRLAPVEGEEFGEIQARGPNVFAGYLDDPEATEAAFAAPGWFRTRDLGFLDEDGYLHVVGRANEAIVLPGGKKLFPEEIEALYAAIPIVKEVGIFLHEGKLVALVAPNAEAIRERGGARAEGLMREEIEHLSVRLKPHQRISGYAIAPEALPRTNLGKLKRHQLPAIYARARAGAAEAPRAAPSAEDAALLAAPGAAAVWQWLVERYPDRRLTLDTSLQFDLGIDSLQAIELSLALQNRFGIELGGAVMAEALSVRDLLRAVTQPRAAPDGAALAKPVPTAAEMRWLEPPGPAHAFLGLLLHGLNRLAMRLLFRLRVRGKDRIPPTGPVVLVPNHVSYLDPPTLAAAFGWGELRRTHWAGWIGVMLSGPFMRALSRATNVLPVDPDRNPGAALALGVAALRRNRRLVWFPEGRRSPSGEVGVFLPGIGYLVREAGARAVPVRISGTFEALPRTRRFPRLVRLKVVFGEALAADELEWRGPGAEPHARIANALRAAVLALPAGE